MKRPISKLFSTIALLLLFASPSYGKSFTSQYCQFELPSGWACALEGTEWVCQSSNKDRKKEAIIILAAKVRGEKDSLADYQMYLKKGKTFKLPGGKTQVSEPKYTRSKKINNHQWIDSLHLASEVPGFYTRYLATVKADLGVAVTFSVAKDHYESYRPVFDQVAATLRVFRQKGVDLSKFKLKREEEDILDSGDFIDDHVGRADITQKKRKKKASGMGDKASYAIIFLIIGALFFIIKRKKSKKGKKK